MLWKSCLVLVFWWCVFQLLTEGWWIGQGAHGHCICRSYRETTYMYHQEHLHFCIFSLRYWTSQLQSFLASLHRLVLYLECRNLPNVFILTLVVALSVWNIVVPTKVSTGILYLGIANQLKGQSLVCCFLCLGCWEQLGKWYPILWATQTHMQWSLSRTVTKILSYHPPP